MSWRYEFGAHDLGTDFYEVENDPDGINIFKTFTEAKLAAAREASEEARNWHEYATLLRKMSKPKKENK